MNRYVTILLLLLPQVVLNMQLEIAASRRVYRQTADTQRAQGFCFFCDEATLKNNFIVSEDYQRDIRVMMNKTPYFPFDQGQHLLVMPIAHEEDPDKISEEQIKAQCDAIQKLSATFYDHAYHQEFFTNWGKIAGQSVAHWHSQFKNYTQKPMSVPDCVLVRENPCITKIEDALLKVQERLASTMYKPVRRVTLYMKEDGCLSCKVGRDESNDKNNLVIARFMYNYVVLSHYPAVPAELSVVPFHHASSIKDLSQETFYENMIIATALMRKVQTYANEHVRECTGANLYTKSVGAEAEEKYQKGHVHTLVMPRTTIVATPGTLAGDSCKLDYDPVHFYEFAKNIIAGIID
jgi:diadenosine tetraphosphate (Ap4A) HIT family hydrolase